MENENKEKGKYKTNLEESKYVNFMIWLLFSPKRRQHKEYFPNKVKNNWQKQKAAQRHCWPYMQKAQTNFIQIITIKNLHTCIQYWELGN